MALGVWFSLFAACVVLSRAMKTISVPLAYGWKRSLWAILGRQLALLFLILLVSMELGVIVANSPVLFNAIRFLGAAYLVHLGIRMMMSKFLIRKKNRSYKRRSLDVEFQDLL